MKSLTIAPFWALFAALPAEIQRKARQAFAQFSLDPFYPRLNFKEVNVRYGIWSARVDEKYRVLGYRRGGEIRWFWIGTHAEYDKLLDRLK